MICYRRACLSIALLCFCAAVASTAWGQNPLAPQQPPPTQEKKPPIAPIRRSVCELVPAKLAADGSGIHFGNADRSGKFSVQELPPGHYRVYALASVDLFVLQNPKVLEAIEPFGTDVDLKENDKAAVALHVVPVDQAAWVFSRSRIQ